MKPSPIYQGHNLNPAFHLRYTWNGWLSSKSQMALPIETLNDVLEQTKPMWEQDGLRLLEPSFTADWIALTFSTKPTVSPVFLAARAKGRLQHSLRLNGTPCKFSRKVGVRAVGENRVDDVEQYISKQVQKSNYVDPAFKKKLQQFIFVDEAVDLSLPTETHSGRYWYDLHIVLVVEGRYKMIDESELTLIHDGCLKIAAKRQYRLSRLAVMPDHVHMALRADIAHSPQEVVLGFQNNLAYVLGQRRVWSYNYYVGTFGIYDMNAIRNK